MAKFVGKKWTLISFIMVCAFLVFAVIPAKAAGPVVLRAGASDPEGTTAPALSIGKLCELATKLRNGELNVQPFYQSLGVEQQLAAGIKAGTIDIGFTATPNLAPFTDAYLQFYLPFLFKNDRAYIDVLENHPAGKKALAQFEKDLGVKVLLITSHTYDAPVSGTDLMIRSKPAKVPADLKGLKIRTSSTPVEINLLKAYGYLEIGIGFTALLYFLLLRALRTGQSACMGQVRQRSHASSAERPMIVAKA